MNLINDANDSANELLDMAGDVTAAAADLAIEGVQSALGGRRRLRASGFAAIVALALLAVALRKWRSGGGGNDAENTSSRADGGADNNATTSSAERASSPV